MKTIKLNNETKIAVVGDIHEHPQQFFEIIEKVKPSEKMVFVSVGDIYDKGFGRQAAEKIIDCLIPYVNLEHAYVIKGNHELKTITKSKNIDDKYIWWFKKQPLSLSFMFENGYRLTVVHGGVTPKHTWEDLEKNAEICYVRTVDENGKMIPLIWKEDKNGVKQLVAKKEGQLWHDVYDGRFGYVASGHNAQKDGVPKFYEYSCNLDSAVYSSGIFSCQIFGLNGKEELIQATGPAKNPVLVGMPG